MKIAMIGLFLCLSAGSAVAADYALAPAPRVAAYVDRGPNPYCGPRCGCPTVTYVRHRQLVQFLPSSFDPRTRDEPYYTFGSVRTYSRYGLACATSAPVKALY